MSRDDRDQRGGHRTVADRHPGIERNCCECNRGAGIGRKPSIDKRRAITEPGGPVMADYTPPFHELELGYIERAKAVVGTPHFAAGLEFDRAIAAHDREVAAKALREAADEWSDWDALTAPEDWLRRRADAVESADG